LIGFVVAERLLNARVCIFTLSETFGTAVTPCSYPSSCGWIPILTSKVIIVPVPSQYEVKQDM
jgi:hypothetical protein